MKIGIINGPNLNLLGTRQPQIYGNQTLNQIIEQLQNQFTQIEFTHYQSNIEGELINSMQSMAQNHQAIILNAGAYSHTSIALADCIKSISIPVISVHLSNIYNREPERHTDLLLAACIGGIYGFGPNSYTLAVHAIINHLA